MKLLLDCDDVFDRLTRGPFPSGAEDDSAVEAHLCACHECRQLAEALRPAVELLHEAYADEVPESDLPVYRGSSTGGLTSPARQQKEWTVGWQLVAASLLGVVIGSLAVSGWFGQRVGHSATASIPNRSGLAMLASLQLNDVCLPSSMSLASNQRLRCCTDCHSSGESSRKGIDVARLQLACVACHDRTP